MDQSAAPAYPLLPTVAVVGLGTMGTGIAEILARSGRDVIGIDISDTAAREATESLEASTARLLEQQRLTVQQRQEIIKRLRVSTDLRAAAEADLVIEVVPENYSLKLSVFTALDEIVKPTTILATGTNALPITKLATETAHPERVVGLHFFHPAQAMKLVEVVSSVLTSPEAVEAVSRLARELGKEPLPAGDRTGLVADGLLFGYLNQAAAMYESRYATRDDIDAAMRLGCGLPMGPLAVLDLIGIDTARTVLEAMYERTGDRLHAPAPVLGQLAEAGMTGRKAGRGFYTYQGRGSGTVVGDEQAAVVESDTAEPRPVAAVGVVGSGTMASGIVEVFAKAGYPVVVTARSEQKAVAARDRVAASLERSVKKGRLSAGDRDATLARIVPADSLDALSDVNLVVEAVAEDLAVKRQLFASLDQICRPGAVLATTTSSLPVIACARATSRPADVIGMHFFNPAPAMKLVEIVRTVLTGDDVHATVRAVCRTVRKHPVDCGDRAGFIVNALLFPYLNNAVKMVEEHYATPEAIDTAMKLGAGYPMGPFELLDVVGLDVSLAIEDVLHREFRDESLAPAPLLRQLVAAGCLGRKTGRGFHEYARR
ncbi:3-hydroxyacyl-CoA dehydrogenase family protein [Streptomyces sp. NBC_01803]|uniref:3-hydroxyacyl-CoA dehydrogenase family protein n=1 Tax=Streptomyces sp. NBC_01803 TaxID=2975946 RepID=UPI002DDC48DC|nr:3-hydroxybutyryl-CoA dehydrogenase [Streptomyces sp. NBC_01803]WSA43540.1 3-hydroxybutyryl-CoA dehydrogenase [Streptomyces sp. NBC_01803]